LTPGRKDAEHLFCLTGAGWKQGVHLTLEHKSRRRDTSGA